MTALKVLDATGTTQNMSATTDGSGNLVGSACVTDPATGNKQAVGPFPASDAQTVSGNAGLVSSVDLNWNGSGFDRRRNNTDATASLVTLSAQAAGTVTSADLTNHNNRGMQLGINITTISGGTPTTTVTIQGKDVVSGVYYNLLTSVAINSTVFTLLTVYPGATVVANAAVSTPLPRTWRVSVTVAGAGNVTGTIGASHIA